MTLVYAAKLGLTPRPTNIGTQKVNSLALETYGMITVDFSVEDKLGRIRFFEETFLLANISIEVILEISLLLLSYINVDFKIVIGGLTWRSYDTTEVLPTISQV